MNHEEVPKSFLLDEPVLCFSDLHVYLQLCAPHHLHVQYTIPNLIMELWKLYRETLQSSATIPSPNVVNVYWMSSIFN